MLGKGEYRVQYIRPQVQVRVFVSEDNSVNITHKEIAPTSLVIRVKGPRRLQALHEFLRFFVEVLQNGTRNPSKTDYHISGYNIRPVPFGSVAADFDETVSELITDYGRIYRVMPTELKLSLDTRYFTPDQTQAAYVFGSRLMEGLTYEEITDPGTYWETRVVHSPSAAAAAGGRRRKRAR
jgi:hypothetical protein